MIHGTSSVVLSSLRRDSPSLAPSLYHAMDSELQSDRMDMDATEPLTVESSNNTSGVDDNMSSNRSSSATMEDFPSSTTMRVALAVYCVLFCIALYMISTTLHQYPLFPFQPDSLEWNYNWLIATVFDYYGACLCFGGIVMSSEPSWAKAIAWNTGFVLLGSPVCCLWMILRIRRMGSLRLVDTTAADATRRD